MREMSESIPLGSTLGVQMVYIIVRKVLSQHLDLMPEGFAIEGGLRGHIKGKAFHRVSKTFGATLAQSTRLLNGRLRTSPG